MYWACTLETQAHLALTALVWSFDSGRVSRISSKAITSSALHLGALALMCRHMQPQWWPCHLA